jgi:hypothetical protein
LKIPPKVIHRLKLEENFIESDEIYEDFIVQMIQEGRVVWKMK